jgi:glucose-6-phosphate-specific signal transduction histidine kinase
MLDTIGGLHMIKWIKKIQWSKVILIAFMYMIVSMVLQQVESLFMVSVIPSNRSPNELFIASTIAKFFTGVSLCIIYYYLMEYLPKKKWQRIFFFCRCIGCDIVRVFHNSGLSFIYCAGCTTWQLVCE